ncbi:MAG: ATPase P [Eubacterium sp.]|jgi:hypothetical protein
MFKPSLIGVNELSPEALEEDRTNALKIGKCGVGEKALYLNSFYISRRYYVKYEDVARVFKQVAMSRGGFTGKGVFGSMPYFVVQMKNGETVRCNFKYENQVDDILEVISREHPEIPTRSVKAEKRLREEIEAEEAKYLKELSPDAQDTVDYLTECRDYLLDRRELSDRLSAAAKEKRIVDNITPTYKIMAVAIILIAVVLAAFGFYALITHKSSGMYFLLFAFAIIMMVAATQVLPTRTRNKDAMQAEWDAAVKALDDYIKEGADDFPVPARYAHPIVIDRMIRVVREGRATDEKQAFDVMVDDLKKLNSSVTVTQKEYDEVITVKPLFMVSNYQ